MKHHKNVKLKNAVMLLPHIVLILNVHPIRLIVRVLVKDALIN